MKFLKKTLQSLYFVVKEKVKMIAQQQEEIVRREEMKRAKSGVIKSRGDGGPPTGGVRILPPSPTTVRDDLTSSPPAMSVNSASSVSTYKESKQFSSMTSSSETKMVGEKLQASASQASVGHSLSQTSLGAGSSSQSVYDMMYDAQVLSPIMSTNNVALMNESDLLAMTQSGGLSKAKNEVVVRRGEVSKTTEMVQQKSESVR